MNKAQTVLASIVIVGFICITIIAFMAVKFGDEWAKAMMQNILPLLVGCWMTLAGTVINYVFGTSQSSQRKSEMLDKLAAKNAEPVLDLTNPVK